MPIRPEPRIIKHSCPKCKTIIHVTVQRENAERHPAKCICGWEGRIKDPEGKTVWFTR